MRKPSRLELKVIEHFEKHMLDGDEVKTGDILAATAVQEYIVTDLIKFLKKELI